MQITIKKQGRTFGVFVNGKLVEGGFFTKAAAEACARELANQ
jgi:hypothetical protein